MVCVLINFILLFFSVVGEELELLSNVYFEDLKIDASRYVRTGWPLLCADLLPQSHTHTEEGGQCWIFTLPPTQLTTSRSSMSTSTSQSPSHSP